MSLGADEADVREVFLGILGNLQEQGDILDLDPFIELLDQSDFYPAVLEACTIEGETWAIPYGVNSQVMYYNQDLFDQHGIPYPEIGWTWDDFVSTALAIRDPDAGVYGYVSLGDFFDIMIFIYQHGGRIFDDFQNPTRMTFDDPLNVEALKWYSGLYREHDVAYASERRERKQAVVLADKVGMWSYHFGGQGGLDGLWAGQWPMHWGMVTFPRSTADTATDIVGDLFVNGYAISSQTQHPDAAWKLIAFLSRQMRDNVTVPARRSLAESTEYEQQVGSDIAAVTRACLEHGLTYSPRVYSRFVEALIVLGEAADMVESGERTAQEAVEWAEREAETRLGP